MIVMVVVAFGTALLVGLGGSPAGTSEPAVDVSLVIDEARRTYERDLAAWAGFRFRRRVERRRLNKAGTIVQGEDWIFELTPGSDGFDETLVEIDGREPTSKEVASHRKAARFTKHYRMIAGETAPTDRDPLGDGLSLRTFLHLSSYRFGGRDTRDGFLCYRLDFDPPAGPLGGGLKSKFGEAIAGSLWITAEGHHIIRVEAGMVKPVTFLLSLFKVASLDFVLEARPVAPDTWLPRRIEITATGRNVARTYRKQNVYTYSSYSPAG